MHILQHIPGGHKVTIKKCTSSVSDDEYGNITTRTFVTMKIVGMLVSMSDDDYSNLLEQAEGEHEYARLILLTKIDEDLPNNSLIYDDFFSDGMIYEVVGKSDRIKHYYDPLRETANYSEFLLRKYTGVEVFA